MRGAYDTRVSCHPAQGLSAEEHAGQHFFIPFLFNKFYSTLS